jgi:hypothetical protein
LTRSMSKKGCTPDNAACEGFFGRLKNEMYYNRSWNDISMAEFIDLVDEYISWYNLKRIKLTLGGLSPAEYRESIPAAAKISPRNRPQPRFVQLTSADDSVRRTHHCGARTGMLARTTDEPDQYVQYEHPQCVDCRS